MLTMPRRTHRKGPAQADRTVLLVLALGALGALFALPFLGVRGALSILAGGVLAGANLWAIGRLVSGLLGSGPKAPWVVLSLLKMVLLVGVVIALVVRSKVDLFPLILGYGALPLGIVLGPLVQARSTQEEG
jgi:hypothetical protein